MLGVSPLRIMVMNLFDIVSQAQGGNAINNLAEQFGLDQSQAESAVKHVLPAFSKSLQNNTADADGLKGLLGALQGGNHQRYDDASLLGSQQATDEGNGILGHIFGSKDVSRGVASHVAGQTGISDSIIKQMLPSLATMVMSSLGKQVASSAMRGGIDALLGRGGRGGLFGSLLSGFLVKKAFGSKKPTGQSVLGSLLASDGDGSYMDDLLRMAGR
jgi:hypothetical protein